MTTVSCSDWDTLEIENAALSSLGPVSGLEVLCAGTGHFPIAGFRNSRLNPALLCSGRKADFTGTRISSMKRSCQRIEEMILFWI